MGGGALNFLISATASAEYDPNLLKNYYTGNFQFNGEKITSSDGSLMFNNKEKWAKSNIQGRSEYEMRWNNEDIEGTKILAITEAIVTPAKKLGDSQVVVRTSTFNGSKLRSSTVCYGELNSYTRTTPFSKGDMKCVTATKRACKRLNEAYNIETKKRKGGAPLDEENAKKCMDMMDSYATMAKAFGNQSIQLEKRQMAVIEADNARIEKQMKLITGNKIFSPVSISTPTTSENLSKMAKDFSSSIKGMEALNRAIQTCNLGSQDFSAEESSSPSTTNSVIQKGKE